MKTVILAALATFWCRAEPVTPNGDTYLVTAPSIEEACYKVMDKCEVHYPHCEITYCGEGHSATYDDQECMPTIL